MSDLTDYAELKDKPSLFTEKIVGVEPFDYQSNFMDDDSDRKVFVAGRQVGKSRVASWMALHYAVTHPDSLVLVTADALRQSSELFSQLKSEISNSGMSDEAWGIDRSTQTEIEFGHGSRIKVVPTGRNGNKIRGFTADMIIVDEAAFVEDQIFEEVIEPMTFVSDGTIALCSTPYGASGYFYRKADGVDPDEDRWHVTSVSSADNPMIEQEDIESFKSGKTHSQIKQEVYGEFVPTGDQFFPNSLIRSSLNDGVQRGIIHYGDNQVEREIDEAANVYAGVDLASSGEDETVISMCDEYGNVFRVENKNLDLIEARNRVATLHRHYGFEEITVDRTGLGEGPVQEMQHELGDVVAGVYLSTQQKQSVYQTLKSKMQSGDVSIIHQKDIRLQLEQMGYKRTKTGNLSIHAKGDFHDDIPDAIALSVWGMSESDRGGGRGARGMTEPVTLGEVRRDEDGGRSYQFTDTSQDNEDLDRSTVGSSYRIY